MTRASRNWSAQRSLARAPHQEASTRLFLSAAKSADAKAAMIKATTSVVAEAEPVDAVDVADETDTTTATVVTTVTTATIVTTAKHETGATGSLAKSRADQTMEAPG
jgi:hypothetical protein